MTISTIKSRNDYLGTGSADTFAYEFMILDETHLLVTVQNDLGAISTLTLGSDYTVTGVGEATGGDVVLTAGNLASDYRLGIRRNPPLTQLTSIRNQGQFFAATHEETFDKLLMNDQELKDFLDRSLKFPETEQIGDAPISAALFSEIPPALLRAGLVLAFDSDGNPTAISAVPVGSVAFSSFWLSMVATASAATAYAAGLKDMFNGFWQDMFTATDAATTRTKLEFGTTAKFIVEGDLALVSVGTPELIDGAVTDAKIAAGTITADKLAFTISDAVVGTKTLVVVKTSATVATATADTLAVGEFGFTAVSQTATITTSGLGGLDTGIEAISTWYSIWAICKSDGSGMGLLLSASMTTPTMPTGYVGTAGRKTRLGFVYNNASGDFDDFRIVGNRFINRVVNGTTYCSWADNYSWDGNALGPVSDVWTTQALHPATSPSIECEVFIESDFFIGGIASAGDVYYGPAGLFTGSSNAYKGLPTHGGASINSGTGVLLRAFASLSLVQNSSRQIDIKINRSASWNSPTLRMSINGFRIPAL